MLLEPVGDALLRSHPLEDATIDAAALARGESLGREVVNAGDEAVLDKAVESLQMTRVSSDIHICRPELLY